MNRLLSLVALGVALLVVAGAVGFVVLDEDDPPSFGALELREDPFAWSSEREDEFRERAAAGHSQVIYAKSPGGVQASAARVERYRERIEAVASETGVDPDVIEGMVFLESAGLPDAMASDDIEGAAGLTQILAETAVNLLGMSVDVDESRRLTRELSRAERRGDERRAERLRERRREVDERFDPDAALEGTGRYLATALESFGREDLAVVSYHMGIGNLQDVLAAYGEDDPGYAQLFFDATPESHPRAYRLLTGLSDDSKTYLWRVLASAEIMRLYREGPEELERRRRLYTAKASSEEVLHPRSETTVYEEPSDLEEAFQDGDLRPFPDEPARYGLRRSPRMGELAEDPALYRGLRPEAFALAVYMADGVREAAGTRTPLIVTSTVRDQGYQDALVRRNGEATRGYSLHTTGYSFDVRRRYRSERQAVAFQYMLDRLQALNLIAWVREPGAIHITVSSEARRLLPG